MSSPPIVPSSEEPRRVWRVGNATVTATSERGVWVVRVQRADWGEDTLDVDDRFRTLDEAIAWSEKLARMLQRDEEDDSATADG